MKITIAQDGVKRSLADKPFSICIDREAAKALAEGATRFLSGPGVYGWVDIYPEIDSPSNCDPIPWTSGI